VVTPEAVVLEARASSVSLPAHDGEIGILRNRAPLVCSLGIGVLRLETDEGPQRLFVDGGFAEVHDNQLTILTNRAERSDDIDGKAARQALDEASAMRITDEASLTARQNALARAKARLRLAPGGE
jgi:F-type H+-transporting ATPase subunit epsilon